MDKLMDISSMQTSSMQTSSMQTSSMDAELTQPAETKYVLHRRFDRLGRLVGDASMLRLFQTHVMVVGLGVFIPLVQ